MKRVTQYITREDENSPDGYTIVKRGQDWGMIYESYWKYKNYIVSLALITREV